jgi:transcriptional regulator with XRE-family HTH domain
LAHGVEHLANEMNIAPSAVYQWVRGKTSPHPAKAVVIQRIAKRCGVSLSLDEIYKQHFLEVDKRPTSTSPLKPETARA